MASMVKDVVSTVVSLLSAWMVRRYVGEIQRAREELDAVNAGLEDTVRDRTAALTRANDEIQRFAYIVSHDLRAPLVNVMGYTSELEQAGKVIDAAIREAEAEGQKAAWQALAELSAAKTLGDSDLKVADAVGLGCRGGEEVQGHWFSRKNLFL